MLITFYVNEPMLNEVVNCCCIIIADWNWQLPTCLNVDNWLLCFKGNNVDLIERQVIVA